MYNTLLQLKNSPPPVKFIMDSYHESILKIAA